MKNRFDLENEISQLYNIADSLSNLSEGVLEYDLSKDDIVNTLAGIKVLLTLQTEKLLDTMAQCFKLDHYNNKV